MLKRFIIAGLAAAVFIGTGMFAAPRPAKADVNSTIAIAAAAIVGILTYDELNRPYYWYGGRRCYVPVDVANYWFYSHPSYRSYWHGGGGYYGGGGYARPAYYGHPAYYSSRPAYYNNDYNGYRGSTGYRSYNGGGYNGGGRSYSGGSSRNYQSGRQYNGGGRQHNSGGHNWQGH